MIEYELSINILIMGDNACEVTHKKTTLKTNESS